MDFLPIILAIAISILTITLVVVGVYVVLVLREVKQTLEKVNVTIDSVEERINAVVTPMQHLAGMASNLQVGLRVFEAFTSWLSKGKTSEK